MSEDVVETKPEPEPEKPETKDAPKFDHLANAQAAWKKVGELMKANPKLQVPY